MRNCWAHPLDSRPHRHATGGIARHGGPTRRRHAARRLHVVQNPRCSQPEVRRAASKTGAGSVGAKKLAQHGPSSRVSAKKLAQQAKKRRFWGVLSVQGELFRAHAHIRPSRANFFAHEARQRGDVETINTTAHPQQGNAETDDTSATEKRTQSTRFSPAKATPVATGPPHRPAKAMTVSVETQPARAKATMVSDSRPTWPTGSSCGTSRYQCARCPKNSHAIRLREVSTKARNAAIPTL